MIFMCVAMLQNMQTFDNYLRALITALLTVPCYLRACGEIATFVEIYLRSCTATSFFSLNHRNIYILVRYRDTEVSENVTGMYGGASACVRSYESVGWSMIISPLWKSAQSATHDRLAQGWVNVCNTR